MTSLSFVHVMRGISSIIIYEIIIIIILYIHILHYILFLISWSFYISSPHHYIIVCIYYYNIIMIITISNSIHIYIHINAERKWRRWARQHLYNIHNDSLYIHCVCAVYHRVSLFISPLIDSPHEITINNEINILAIC